MEFPGTMAVFQETVITMSNKCICSSSGYCEYLRQTVGSSLLKACQGWPSELRDKIRSQNISCEQHPEQVFTKLPSVVFNRYITIEMLAGICKFQLLPKLPAREIGGIIGIPRSGMIVASILASFIHVPLYYFNENDLFVLQSGSTFGGRRMSAFNNQRKKMLVIDDWVWKGNEIRRAKKMLSKHSGSPTSLMPTDFIFASIFVDECVEDEVDFYVELLDHKYPYCEWNFFTDASMPTKIFDLDGLLCPDAPANILDNESEYRDFISNAPPFVEHFPKKIPCQAILTGRSEKYRDVTEDWLKSHGVLYRDLIMYPENKPLPKKYDFSDYKSKIYSASDATLLVESNCLQAQLIYNKTKKPTLCLPEGRIFRDG